MSFPFIAALSDRAVTIDYPSSNSFNVGDLGMTEDGSKYRLCVAGAALITPQRAKINSYDYLAGVTSGECIEAVLSTAIAAGDTSCILADATNSFAANFFKGGYLVQPRSAGDNMRRIWKSGAEDSDKFTMYVTAPFTVADAQGNTVQAYPSPWGSVKNYGESDSGSRYEQFVCAIPNNITNGYYFWGQVSGPHWFGSYTGTWPGDEVDDRMLCFHQDGTVTMLDRATQGRVVSLQIAGYLMYSGNYGDTLCYMQIE